MASVTNNDAVTAQNLEKRSLGVPGMLSDLFTTFANEFTDESSAAAKVFDIAELLEAILLHVPLNRLIITQRVSKQFQQAIAESIKLQTALGYRPLAGYPKDLPSDHQDLKSFLERDSLSIKDGSQPGSRSTSISRFEDWSQLQSEMLSATDYLSELKTRCIQEKVNSRFAVDSIFALRKDFRWATGSNELQFLRSMRNVKFISSDQDEPWRKMFATQPPAKMLILEPTNDYELWGQHHLLTNTAQRNMKRPLALINEGGVKIDDVLTGIEFAKTQARQIWWRLNSEGWRSVVREECRNLFEHEIRLRLEAQRQRKKSKAKKDSQREGIIAYQDDQQHLDFEDWDEDGDYLGAGGLKTKDDQVDAELWENFRFQLSTPDLNETN